MTIRVSCPAILVASVVLVMLRATSHYGVSQAAAQVEHPGTATASTQASADVEGTWSGNFFPRHSNVSSFTLTVVIGLDSKGHLVGDASSNSDCLKGAHLQVTVTGSSVVFAGSSDANDSFTLRGTLDSTGTLLKATYILNGSASGRCETDNGTANLAKR